MALLTLNNRTNRGGARCYVYCAAALLLAYRQNTYLLNNTNCNALAGVHTCDHHRQRHSNVNNKTFAQIAQRYTYCAN